jgi:cytochrome c-type biogenesis protein CcsB
MRGVLMVNTVILSYITFFYFFCFLVYLIALVTGRQTFGRVATYATIAGFAGHTVGIGFRWVESYNLGIGHAPLSNLYESLIFFSWAIILLYLVVERRIGNRSIGTFVTPLAFLSLAYASFSENVKDSIQPLVPALQSNWLTAHVITCFFGYAAFAVSFGMSLMYFIKMNEAPDNKSAFLRLIPGLNTLDELSYQMVVIGFLLLTLGIITGSVWAHSAWGSYWTWDPKETWSLVTWLVYAAMLHSRLIRGWKGKRLAIFSVLGFICVLVTYFGVNYLSSLHSYSL